MLTAWVGPLDTEALYQLVMYLEERAMACLRDTTLPLGSSNVSKLSRLESPQVSMD